MTVLRSLCMINCHVIGQTLRSIMQDILCIFNIMQFITVFVSRGSVPA
jgi:hypothetical protein